MFEKAARLKIRFSSPQGQLTVEDLFDLPLTNKAGRANLDDIAKGLHRQIRDSAETISFVDTKENGADETLQLKFDIIKYVITVRVAERDAEREAAKRREEKQKILGIIAKKQDGALEGKSLEELQALVEAL